MSQENVELVRSAFQAFAAEGTDAALSFYAPDCVWYTSDRWLDGSAYRGHAGMRKLAAGWDQNVDDYGWDVRDIRDAQDRVVALVHMTGRIKGTESSISRPLGLVISDFRGGTIGETRAFATWNEALEAAGLQE